MFIPKVNLRRTSSWYRDKDEEGFSADDAQVFIKEGQLITGCLDKKSLGAVGGGLIHVIWMEHGPDVTRLFINNTQLTVNHWLLQYGMSIGIGDTVADESTMRTINTIIEVAKEDVKRIIENFQVGSHMTDSNL